MKITIELTPAQIKGIKEYLIKVDDIESPNKKDIQKEIAGILDGYFQTPQNALTDYINKYENQ